MSTGAVNSRRAVAVSRPAQFVALALVLSHVPLAHSWCCGGHRAKTFDRSADCTSCKNWLVDRPECLALAHNATRVVLVESGVARPTGRAEAKVAASARDWEEEEVMTVEL